MFHSKELLAIPLLKFARSCRGLPSGKLCLSPAVEVDQVAHMPQVLGNHPADAAAGSHADILLVLAVAGMPGSGYTGTPFLSITDILTRELR